MCVCVRYGQAGGERAHTHGHNIHRRVTKYCFVCVRTKCGPNTRSVRRLCIVLCDPRRVRCEKLLGCWRALFGCFKRELRSLVSFFFCFLFGCLACLWLVFQLVISRRLSPSMLSVTLSRVWVCTVHARYVTICFISIVFAADHAAALRAPYQVATLFCVPRWPCSLRPGYNATNLLRRQCC